MDLTLEKARVGFRLAVHRINSSITSSESDADNKSPVISVGGGPEDRYDDCPVRYEGQDVDETRGDRITDAGKHVNNCFPRKMTEVEATMMKRPRPNNWKHSQNLESKYIQPEIIKRSEKKGKRNKIGEKSVEELSPPFDSGQPETYASTSSTHLSDVVDRSFVQRKNSESYDGGIESVGSNCSTYFSDFEEDRCDTSFKPQVEKAPTQENSCSQLPTEITSSINSSTHKNSTLDFSRFFDALEDKTLWRTAKMKESIDLIVQLAESNDAEVAKQCKTEAVKHLQKVYERLLHSSKSRAPLEDTQWSEACSILQTLGLSKSICEELIKFFTSHLITPKTVTDLEDPKEIIDGFTEHGTARFVLHQLYNALRTYSKFVEQCDSQSNICNGSSQMDFLDIRKGIDSKKTEFDIELLRKFKEYGATISDHFFDLNYILTKNVMLLKSRKYSESK